MEIETLKNKELFRKVKEEKEEARKKGKERMRKEKEQEGERRREERSKREEYIEREEREREREKQINNQIVRMHQVRGYENVLYRVLFIIMLD